MVFIGVVIGLAAPANASAQTCIAAPGGYICTKTYGSGTYVEALGVSRGKSTPICNYSAWFFYIPPSGGAYGINSVFRAGCGLGRVWLDATVGQNFPVGTQVCAKFYEDNWQN